MRGFPLLLLLLLLLVLSIVKERGTDFGDGTGGGVVAAVDSVCCRETDLML